MSEVPARRPFLQTLRRALVHQRSTDMISLVVSAVVVGTLVGLAAVGFDTLVGALGSFVHRSRVRYGPLAAVFIPALGGLLITPIVVWASPEVRGSGVPSVMLAVSNLGGKVAKRIAFWRPLATTLSIGTGASLGTEGPVVQLGASLASMLGDALRLNDERRRTLVAVAAAGGIAATFNTPIAGVLFALEVILGKFTNRYFAAVVIGSVSASAVSRSILGDDPAFPVPENFHLGSPLELPLYFLLGLLSALVAVLFIRSMVVGEDVFDKLRISPLLRPALGGLMVGMLAFALPQVRGRSFEATGQFLSGAEPFGLWLLLALILGKTLATGVALGSWGSGGIFAPALFVGAGFGAAFGQWSQALLPALDLSPGAFALVGMAAVFSGITRAPMSTIVMIFELSGGYALILPLLLSAGVATLLADALHPESIYQLLLSRRGLSLIRLRETDLLQTVRVEEVMDERLPTLFEDSSLADLEEALLNSHHHGFILTRRDDPDGLVGIVTLTDLERARQAGVPADTALGDVGTQRVHVAYEDEPISDVLERMARFDIGRMPVVERRERRKPVGYVRQSDLAKAYYHAVQRERQAEQREEAQRLRDLTGQEIVEVKIQDSSPLAGKTLREADLPSESIIVAIRRRGATLFPHGDTRFEPGDTVVANVAPGHSARFRQHMAGR